VDTAWFMWLAPPFHHGPWPFIAEVQARVSLSPRAISSLARLLLCAIMALRAMPGAQKRKAAKAAAFPFNSSFESPSYSAAVQVLSGLKVVGGVPPEPWSFWKIVPLLLMTKVSRPVPSYAPGLAAKAYPRVMFELAK